MTYRKRLLSYVVALSGALALAGSTVPSRASSDYDQEPIRYAKAKPADAIAKMQEQINAGKLKLSYDERLGYLPAVLKALEIPATSQSLVFSKTSFQREKITPRSPRALYFNDDVYVGYVLEGDVLEFAAADPTLGMNFYTLDAAKATKKPQVIRQTDNCTQCHAGSMTRDVPGVMIRSVFPGVGGQAILSAGTKVVTHETPLIDRWGGWYVTGTHGAQRHMGNAFARNEEDAEATFDREAGANTKDLTRRFDTTQYLTDSSDIAALMVMEHQVEAHNRITRAGYGVRQALFDEQVMNKALERPATYRSDSTVSRIRNSCEPLVKYLMMSGESPLQEPVRGTTTFASDYAARGPFDKAGRTLRQLDLQHRLFRYPCSPLIYSAGFDGLPPEAKEYIYRRLGEVLSGQDTSKEFQHLSAADRSAVREILIATKSDLPAGWCEK